MPRFHFNTETEIDVEGRDLPGIAAAKCEAVKLAGRIICDEADQFWDSAEWHLTVTDGNGLTQFQLHVIGTDAPALLTSSRGRAA